MGGILTQAVGKVPDAGCKKNIVTMRIETYVSFNVFAAKPQMMS